jgi:hypothetical protein
MSERIHRSAYMALRSSPDSWDTRWWYSSTSCCNAAGVAGRWFLGVLNLRANCLRAAHMLRCYSLGMSLLVRRTSTGVLVFTQRSASLKNLPGTFSIASPTVFTGIRLPFLVAL